MPRFLAIATAALVLAIVAEAHAQETVPDRRNSFVRVDEAALCAAFGVIDPDEKHNIDPGANASARNSTALKKNTLYLLTCDGNVTVKQGDSSVTAASTDHIRGAYIDYHVYTGDYEYLAVYGAGAAAKCVVSRKLCPRGL